FIHNHSGLYRAVLLPAFLHVKNCYLLYAFIVRDESSNSRDQESFPLEIIIVIDLGVIEYV
ncbi:MAG: hypothetical protein WBY22_10205, partial [Nitrososphaeraceae archaeon]